MINQHPSARALAHLAEGRLGAVDSDNLLAHVDNCVLCRGYMTNFAATTPVPIHDHPSPVDPVSAWATTSNGEPEVGEIRRLIWDWTTELGLIVRTADDSVLVRPILRDGAVVDGISRPMGCTIGQHPAALGVLTCAMWLSTAALEARVGRCAESVLSPEDIVEADELGGWILSNVVDPEVAVGLVDVVIESFDALTAASAWAPPSVTQVPSAEQLMDAGLNPGRSLQIVRGDALTSTEVAALRERGLDADSGLPNNIRSLLNRPKFKQRLRARAAQDEMSEAAVRLSLAQELRLPLAARTDDGRELSLERRLEELLR